MEGNSNTEKTVGENEQQIDLQKIESLVLLDDIEEMIREVFSPEDGSDCRVEVEIVNQLLFMAKELVKANYALEHQVDKLVKQISDKDAEMEHVIDEIEKGLVREISRLQIKLSLAKNYTENLNRILS